jgi:O-succinylbenzoic acid--CoA ligase
MTGGGAAVLPEPGTAPLAALSLPGVTHASLVPTQVHRALEDPSLRESLARLRCVLVGGAPLPEGTRRRAIEAGVPLRMSYGSTESTGLVTVTRTKAEALAADGAGPPLRPGAVGVDDAGRIRLGGESLFLGYLEPSGFRDPREDDGSFATGDLGRFDDGGSLHVIGRLDRVFLCGGENLNPETIEAALEEVEGVEEARVEGRADPEWGAVPVAYLRAAVIDPVALERHLRRRLSPIHLPRAYLPWDDSGPARVGR